MHDRVDCRTVQVQQCKHVPLSNEQTQYLIANNTWPRTSNDMELTILVQINCGRFRCSRKRIFLFALRSLPQWLTYWRTSCIRPGWQRTKADVVVSGRRLRSSLAHRGRPTKPHFCNGGRRIRCTVCDMYIIR